MKTTELLDPHQLAVLGALFVSPKAPAALLAQLPHLSRATLYRTLERLRANGSIEVESSQQVRGTVETTWRLRTKPMATQVPDGKFLEAVTAVFLAFVAAPLRALVQARSNWPLLGRYVHASAVTLWVSEEEFHDLRNRVAELLLPFTEPRQGTQATTLALFTLPLPTPDQTTSVRSSR